VKRGVLIAVILIFLHGFSIGQTQLGYGLSTAGYGGFSPNSGRPVPNYPLTPLLHFGLNKHKLIIGPNLYVHQNTPVIFGQQLNYRYQFLWIRHFALFGEFNLQNVRFIEGGSHYLPYNSSKIIGIADGATYKVNSIVNTYGIGFEKSLFYKFNMFVSTGIGMNIRKQKVQYDWSEFPVQEGTFVKPTYYVQIGVTYYIFNWFICKGPPTTGADERFLK
jgi:hypothetical protein